MKNEHDFNLTVAAVAAHFALSPRAVRAYLAERKLRGVRIGGTWRCRWHDVWALEQGPMPRGNRKEDYQRTLLTKRKVAEHWGVSVRTVERWIDASLPTRNVGGNVRVAPVDLKEWTHRQFGLTEVR